MIKLIGGCAAAVLVVSGCATTIDSIGEQSLDSAGASPYIVDIDNNPLLVSDGGCLRTINWNGDSGQGCGGAVAEASQPVATEEPVIEVPASHTQPILSETLNGNALFELDSAELSWEGMQSLEKLIAEISKVEGGAIEVVGHTDDTGSVEYNQQLSTMRAENVRSFIESRVQGVEVSASAQGELDPIADNNTAEGRAQNRRVEVLVRKNTIAQ